MGGEKCAVSSDGRNAFPILDRAAAVEGMGGDESMFDTFIDLLIEDSANKAGEIEDAIDQNDAEQLERVAHSLRGAAATMYAERVREVAHRLEMMGQNEDLSDARVALSCLLDELAALKEYVSTL